MAPTIWSTTWPFLKKRRDVVDIVYLLPDATKTVTNSLVSRPFVACVYESILMIIVITDRIPHPVTMGFINNHPRQGGNIPAVGTGKLTLLVQRLLSQPICSSIFFAIMFFGMAPSIWSTTWPFLKTRSDGMLLMPYWAAIFGFSSTLSFAITAFPA